MTEEFKEFKFKDEFKMTCTCGQENLVSWPDYRTLLEFQCTCHRVWTIHLVREGESKIADLLHEAAVTLNTLATKIRTS